MRRLLVLALAVLAATASPASGQTVAGLEFADWTSAGGSLASGTLAGHSISLSGWRLSELTASMLDGTSTLFSAPYFTPPLPHTDAVEFRAENGTPHAYTLDLGAPTANPVIHLGSLGSTLTFPGGTSITRVSGKNDGFAVAGNVVSGAGDSTVDSYGLNDSNGTIRLNGTLQQITFTATTAYALDGVTLQVGAVPPPVPTPTPTAAVTPVATVTPPTRNVRPPGIEAVRRVATGTEYRCTPGDWEGLVPGASFQYAWYLSRTSTGIRGDGLTASPPAQVGSGQLFTLPTADFGNRYYCSVGVHDAAGRLVTAYSATVLLSGRVETVAVITPRAYGNVRIRGIDVFQVTQPVSWARMFRWPPGAGQDWFEPYCGAGTPTNYRSDPFTYAVADQVLRQPAFGQCETNLPTPGYAPATYLKGDPTRVAYAGVPLDQRKPTTAVIYVDMENMRASDPTQPLDVTLNASVGSRALAGTITAHPTNPPPTSRPWVTTEERSTPAYGVSVTLRPDWLAAAVRSRQPLTLEARVSLPVGAGAGALVECLGIVFNTCASDDRFTLSGVPVFDNLPDLTIKSLALVVNGQTAATFTRPDLVLAQARALFPGGERIRVLPYSGEVNINTAANYHVRCGIEKTCSTPDATDPYCAPFRDSTQLIEDNTRACRTAGVNAALDKWWITHPNERSGYDVLMAVHRYPYADGKPAEPGWKRDSTTIETPGQIPTIAVNDLSLARPLTSAAHELGHALGLPHAHRISDPLTGRTCTKQPGETWWPDYTGRLQGVAFQRPNALRLTNKVRIDTQTAAGALFDLMSYCANGDANAWLSPRNWNRLFATLQSVAARRAGTAARFAQTGESVALGVIGPAGAHITGVVPGNATSDPGSSLRVRARDASGKVIAEAGAHVEPLADAAPGVASFAVPVPDVADSIELLSDGALVDRRDRTRPPSVRVIAPRRGTSAGRRLTVRWRASDPDRDALQATIEYSANGRDGWRGVYQGPSSGRATIPGRFLARGAGARVRVTVDDGFNRATARSARFGAAGSPPQAEIVSPSEGDRLDAGTVALAAAASDDSGRRLRSLTWFAGRRRLGAGERRLATLPPGRLTLRLVARDGAGRKTTVTRRVVVAAPSLRLTRLQAPPRVGTSARTVTVRIATSVAALLRSGGRSWRVGPRARAFAVPLPSRPRTGVLTLRLTITTRGGAARPTIAVLRG